METEKVAVEQIDRDAAADTYEGGHLPDPCCPPKVVARKMRDGLLDDSSYVQAFARHRLSAEARSSGRGGVGEIVRWLRNAEDQAAEDLCTKIWAINKEQRSANVFVGQPYFEAFADAILAALSPQPTATEETAP